MRETERAKRTVDLVIDGKEITVPKGTSLLHAAEQAGKEIPHYCYHAGIPSAPAQCRMCLVEVEGAAKLQPACVTMAEDGQRVKTDSPQALKMRRGVLEFYLVNHPLDCPICDMSGECKLQDYVFEEGREKGRGREPKRVFGRDDFGGDILYYGDRCVMCTRCVRFMEEVAGEPRLTVVERGSRSVIDTFFEEGLEGSAFAGNVVDICPVGALVSKDFLHKARAWDLDHAPSICPNCSQGCNVELHTRDDLVQRIKPRPNPDVNGHWMCDYGRGAYEWINRPDRLNEPSARLSDGSQASAAWSRVLSPLAKDLMRHRAAPFTALASPFASVESLGYLRWAVEQMGSGASLRMRSRRAESELPMPGFPTLVRRRDLAPNIQGASLLGYDRVGDAEAQGGLEGIADAMGVLFVLGDELADADESFGAKARLFVYMGWHGDSPALKNAHYVLPITTFAEEEGSFVNAQGRLQRYWPGVRGPTYARPAWMALDALLAMQMKELRSPLRFASQAFERLSEIHQFLAGISFKGLGYRGAPIAAAGPAGPNGGAPSA